MIKDIGGMCQIEYLGNAKIGTRNDKNFGYPALVSYIKILGVMNIAHCWSCPKSASHANRDAYGTNILMSKKVLHECMQ